MHIRLLISISTCAVAFGGGGCTPPWTERFASPTRSRPVANVVAADGGPAAIDSANQSIAAASPMAGDPSKTTPDLAGVLDQLQQIRAIDPSAEAKLMDQLRGAPADSWPLIAEQFRASLAYREQLASTSGRLAIANDPLAERLGAADVATRTAAADGQQAYVNWPSEPLASASAGTHEAAQVENTSTQSLPLGSRPAANASDAAHSPQVANDIVPATLNAPTQPLDAMADEDWQGLAAKAADNLTGRVEPSPTTTAEVNQHVSLRMLRLLSGDTEGALDPIPGISPAEQDYWSRQIFTLATYLDHHGQPDDKRRAAASAMHLDEAVSHLRELSSLSVRNLAFCKSVYGYGAIEPYAANAFSPGQQVSLYVEVENYHSRSTEKGFCTLLGSTYELLNEAGERVGGGEIPDVDDCCRSRRRDFHIQYSLKLPDHLPPGRYQLKLIIKDRQSDKRGQAVVAFEIKGADPLIAQPRSGASTMRQ